MKLTKVGKFTKLLSYTSLKFVNVKIHGASQLSLLFYWTLKNRNTRKHEVFCGSTFPFIHEYSVLKLNLKGKLKRIDAFKHVKCL
jgi:hypothetical protein